jgi:hypothetical protein
MRDARRPVGDTGRPPKHGEAHGSILSVRIQVEYRFRATCVQMISVASERCHASSAKACTRRWMEKRARLGCRPSPILRGKRIRMAGHVSSPLPSSEPARCPPRTVPANAWSDHPYRGHAMFGAGAMSWTPAQLPARPVSMTISQYAVRSRSRITKTRPPMLALDMLDPKPTLWEISAYDDVGSLLKATIRP